MQRQVQRTVQRFEGRPLRAVVGGGVGGGTRRLGSAAGSQAAVLGGSAQPIDLRLAAAGSAKDGNASTAAAVSSNRGSV